MATLRLRMRNNDSRKAHGQRSVRGCGAGWCIGEFIVIAALTAPTAVLLVPEFNRAVVIALVRDTAERHGLDPDDFLRMAQIESSLNPFAYHPISRASGLFQFLPSTAQQYKLSAVFNARANADAAAALWLDNVKVLRKGLRREPSPGEIYLAHQQGATGAIKLLTNLGRPAGDIVGYDAVTMNGGTEDMTAHAFAAMWIERFQRR